MNSHVLEELEVIAKKAGAVVDCPICGNYDISAFDDDANRQAYAMATNAQKSGVFRSATREEILAEMKSLIDDANHECPDCDRSFS